MEHLYENFKSITWWLLLALNMYCSFNFPKSKFVVIYFTFLVSFAKYFPETLKSSSVFTNVSVILAIFQYS